MFQNTLHRRVACRLLGKYLLAIIHYSPGLEISARRRWVNGLKWWTLIAIVSIPAMLYYLVQAMDAPPDSIITIKSDALYLNLLFVIYGHLVGQTYSAPLLSLHTAERWSMLAHHWVGLTLFGITCAPS